MAVDMTKPLPDRTRTLYNGEHLAALERVKSLRGAGAPLTAIRTAGVATQPASDAELAEARRERLLGAATTCFLSAGFAGTTVDAIARAASMSKATV